MCWVCGEGTTPQVVESYGFSGGGMTPVLRNLFIMSSQVSAFNMCMNTPLLSVAPENHSIIISYTKIYLIPIASVNNNCKYILNSGYFHTFQLSKFGAFQLVQLF